MENITTQYKTQIYSIDTDRDVKVDTKASSETRRRAFTKRQTPPIELKKSFQPH